MLYGFVISCIFTKNASQSAGIILFTGATLTLMQWLFEIVWDKYLTGKINAVSEKQSGIDWLLRFRRNSRNVSLDVDVKRDHGTKEDTNPLSPENAGRELT